MSLLWFIYLLQYSFRCIASLVLCICTFGMLFIGIFGVPNRWCAATLVNYILVAIFLWCNVCIFGELHLWWIIFWLQYFFGVMYLRCIASLVLCICTFGMLCIGNFVGASLVWLLLCNASLVHCFLVLGAIYFWCCVFGAMHCQLYRAGLLPQWRIYFMRSFFWLFSWQVMFHVWTERLLYHFLEKYYEIFLQLHLLMFQFSC